MNAAKKKHATHSTADIKAMLPATYAPFPGSDQTRFWIASRVLCIEATTEVIHFPEPGRWRPQGQADLYNSAFGHHSQSLSDQRTAMSSPANKELRPVTGLAERQQTLVTRNAKLAPSVFTNLSKAPLQAQAPTGKIVLMLCVGK